MSSAPRRRAAGEFFGIHLAAEFNALRGFDASTNELVHRFIDGVHKDNQRYFQMLNAQARAVERLVGRLIVDYYDDVSQEPAGGKQTLTKQYNERVNRSTPTLVSLFSQHSPNVVLIAGRDPFLAFREIVLPKLTWHGAVIRVLNPSPQAHRGKVDNWLARYAAATGPSHFTVPSSGVNFWTLVPRKGQRALVLERMQ